MARLAPGLLLLQLLLFVPLVSAAGQEEGQGMGGDFALIDHHNRPFELNQLRGKLVLLFFGYTYCPDVCPSELANLAAVLDALEAEAQRVQVLFVSLDHQRDTPQVLHDYVGYFGGNMLGLTGSGAQIDRVAGQYRVKYARRERADGDYSLDHSANLYLIDARGELSTVVPYGLPAQHLLDLVRAMLAEES